MPLPWLAIGMGAFNAGQSLLGAYAQRQAQKAKNKAAIKRYERRVENQKRKWFQTLSIWHNKSRVLAPTKRTHIENAARIGEAQAQQGYNRLIYDVSQKNAGLLESYLKKHGGWAGAKNQGASANRMQRMDFGSLAKAQFTNSYLGETQGTEAYKRNVQSIRNRALSALNQVDASVMFEPDTPPPIEFDPDSLGQEELGPLDFLSAGLTGWTSAQPWRPRNWPGASGQQQGRRQN